MKALALAVLLGCGHPAHPPPPNPGSQQAPVVDAAVAVVDAKPLDQDLDRLATRSLMLFDTLVQRFAIAGEDCGKAVQQLDEVVGTYADVIEANAKVLHDGREMQLKLAMRPYVDRFNATAKALMQSKTVAACALDAAFVKAFDQLGKR